MRNPTIAKRRAIAERLGISKADFDAALKRDRRAAKLAKDGITEPATLAAEERYRLRIEQRRIAIKLGIWKKEQSE